MGIPYQLTQNPTIEQVYALLCSSKQYIEERLFQIRSAVVDDNGVKGLAEELKPLVPFLYAIGHNDYDIFLQSAIKQLKELDAKYKNEKEVENE